MFESLGSQACAYKSMPKKDVLITLGKAEMQGFSRTGAMGGTGVASVLCWRELPIVTWILLAFVTVADLLATRGFEPSSAAAGDYPEIDFTLSNGLIFWNNLAL
ncbi:hypothetical protein [Sulfitobacter mediterraneus]|uniref:Uncharacterized protein n=1 Tax=Sulfitobacter mediterraneus TaxID=83219 RepID=A0A2T6BVA9_9RHOB|nr:hypothetical protein [Sulfitobacter mediterraneus]PTX59993.1 hypothetical protein C8N31_1272 [Sulfitobacter mediterraneus]